MEKVRVGTLTVRSGSPRGGEGMGGGNATLERAGVGEGAVNNSVLLQHEQFNQTTTPMSLTYNNTTTTTDHSTSLHLPDIEINISICSTCHRLHAVNIFLAVIKALARLAATDSGDRVRAFGLANTETGVSIELVLQGAQQPVMLLNANLVEALFLLVKTMITENTFKEIDGEFYTERRGQRVPQGVLRVRKLERPLEIEKG